MPDDQAYFLPWDTEIDNIRHPRRELLVNCTGIVVSDNAFTTHQYAGREDYYLQYLIKGEMDVHLHGGGRTVMKPGQAVVYHPNTPYCYNARVAGKEVQYYWVHFTGTHAARIIADCRIQNSVILNIGSDEGIYLDFEEMFYEFILCDELFQFTTAAKLTSILTSISRNSIGLSGGTSSSKHRILNSLTHIHKNYQRILTAKELAAIENLSISRYRALFREQMGCSPNHYITVLRINEAKRLILHSNLPVGAIAEAVGYQDALYFSRVFRMCTGHTPSAFRKIAYRSLE